MNTNYLPSRETALKAVELAGGYMGYSAASLRAGMQAIQEPVPFQRLIDLAASQAETSDGGDSAAYSGYSAISDRMHREVIDPSSTDDFDHVEHRHMAYQALASLDSRAWDVVSLRYGFRTGYPVMQDAIGRRLGIPQRTVSDILARAFETMRAALGIPERQDTHRATWLVSDREGYEVARGRLQRQEPGQTVLDIGDGVEKAFSNFHFQIARVH